MTERVIIIKRTLQAIFELEYQKVLELPLKLKKKIEFLLNK